MDQVCTTTRSFFSIQHLDIKAKNHGFEVSTTSNGLFQLRADPNIWDLYHDKTSWYFSTAEECIAFLEGWSTRQLYEQVKKGGKKSGNNGRRTTGSSTSKRRK